jgi:ADP-ribose pyrophosphatase YjhB (NUDIX family)
MTAPTYETSTHECSDPYCPKNGKPTCVLCDDCGPPLGADAECSVCNRPALRRSAVSIVRDENRFLCVWNNRFHGWAMPGGMVEDGETIDEAQERELREEVGLQTTSRVFVYCGNVQKPSNPDRSSHVHVFYVTALGVALAREKGCPIAWLTRDELLAQSPFADFYTIMFEKINATLLV